MAKKFDIKRSVNKDSVYGTLLEISQNKSVWHESSVSSSYSRLTEEGKEVIVDVVESLLRSMQDIRIEEIKEQAKKQTMEALK